MPINYCIAMHSNSLDEEAPKRTYANRKLIDSTVCSTSCPLAVLPGYC